MSQKSLLLQPLIIPQFKVFDVEMKIDIMSRIINFKPDLF